MDSNSTQKEIALEFIRAFKWATQVGMEVDFFITFMDHINSGYSIIESILRTNREWDL